MYITTRMRYGLRAAVELALAGAWRGGSGGGARVPLAAVAKRQQIDLDYLKQIFVALRRRGIVVAVVGRTGGYALARPPERITALDIAKSLDEGTDVVHCVDDPSRCSRKRICPTRALWLRISTQVRASLAETTVRSLADACPRARREALHDRALAAAGPRLRRQHT